MIDCLRISSELNSFFELFLQTIFETWICSDSRTKKVFSNGLLGENRFDAVARPFHGGDMTGRCQANPISKPKTGSESQCLAPWLITHNRLSFCFLKNCWNAAMAGAVALRVRMFSVSR